MLLTCFEVNFFIFFTGTPAYRYPESNIEFSNTTLPAPIITLLLIRELSKIIEPIPIKQFSLIWHPWITALCPIVTWFSIIVFDLFNVVWTTTPSWIFTAFPNLTEPKSPLITALYHKEQYSSILTSPIIVEFSAQKVFFEIIGFYYLLI